MISNGRIADELVKHGHEVIFFEPDFLFLFNKINPVKLAKRLPVHNMSTIFLDTLSSFTKADVLGDGDLVTDTYAVYKYGTAFNQLCQELLKNDDLLEELRTHKFDAFFGEQLNYCGNAIAHAIGIKTHFWVTSCPMAENQASALGLPIPLSYVPAGVNVDMTIYPSYKERIYNIIVSNALQFFYRLVNIELTAIFRHKFGPDFPHVEDIVKESDIVFVSTDEFIELPRPTLPNIVHIGGLGLSDKAAVMPESFEKEMNKGNKGVVYFSFGTIVNSSSLPSCVLASLAETAQAYPDYHFIARIDKYDNLARELAAKTENLVVYEWLPQPAILLHPRLQAFITHAGYNGLMEAARAGVPLITIPFMFDQSRNSRVVEKLGWGAIVHRKSFRHGSEELIEGLGKVLNDDKYKKAASRIRNLVRNKPFNATERLIKYTNFVLDNGGIKELLVEGRNLGLIRYYNLDIFIPFGLFFVAVIYLFLKAFYFVLKVVFSCQSLESKVKAKFD